MTTTYRSFVVACWYLGTLCILVLVWLLLPQVPRWGALVLAVLGALGFPFTWSRLEVGEEGIRQRSFRRHFAVRWPDIISWERLTSLPDSKQGPDIITIKTRAGSLALDHRCINGSRLDEIESELRARVAQRGVAPNGGPTTPPANSGAQPGPPSVS